MSKLMQSGLVSNMIGICKFCKKNFHKREKTRKFCCLNCSNRFNRNGLREINLPVLSQDLAEFIGIILGDGGITHFQCTVYLNSETDREFAYYVRDLVLKLFGLTPKIYVHKKHKVWRVSISSVSLVEYLISRGLSIGSKVGLQAGVPDWIWFKTDYIKACIRGLIDTDGSFILHKYKVKQKQYTYLKISFTNRSQPLIDFIYQALTNLGFNPKKSYKYQVWLHNQAEVRRYLDVIGVNNCRPNLKSLGWVARVA